jgi:hypothetical protein
VTSTAAAVASATETVHRLANGYQISQAIYAAVELGIPDLLSRVPRPSDDLAAATGADPRALYRVLRALAAVGVLHEDGDRRFTLTELGDCLRTDAAEPVASWAAFACSPPQWQAWGNLLHTVRSGENAFRHTHGTDVWQYRAAHPEAGALFDAAMTGNSRREAGAILDAYDFSRFGTVADVGGGRGLLLAAILAQYPTLQGILFDQAHVAPGAEETLRAAGVADRCRVQGGSFFEVVPTGADAYILKKIIHDWEDVEATAILRTCRGAMHPRAAVLLIEFDLGPPNAEPRAKLSDLNMMVSPGGVERTREEYATLFNAAGLRLTSVTPAAGGVSIFEGVPV